MLNWVCNGGCNPCDAESTFIIGTILQTCLTTTLTQSCCFSTFFKLLCFVQISHQQHKGQDCPHCIYGECVNNNYSISFQLFSLFNDIWCELSDFVCTLYVNKLSLRLLVANLANTKWCKNPEIWLKAWNMGTHLTVFSESFPMNTTIPTWQGLNGFQKSLHPMFWTKVTSASEG